MKTWEVIKKKCPECGAELHVNLMYCNADDLCKVQYNCDCGWWICMEKIPLKDVVRREVMNLIDREETLKAMDTWDKFGCDENCRLIPLRGIDENSYVPYVHYDDMVKAVKGMPSPQKTGKWIVHTEIENVYGGIYIECSECGESYVVQHLEAEIYCRTCGSKNGGVG